MSFTNGFEDSVLGLLFTATAIANVADNAGTSPLTNLYVSLHTGDPGEAGNQETNEAAYTSYARVAVARSGSGWTVSSGSVSPDADITFPEATGGSETETHAGIGSLTSGTGVLYMSGAISPNISVSTSVTPIITTSSTITLD